MNRNENWNEFIRGRVNQRRFEAFTEQELCRMEHSLMGSICRDEISMDLSSEAVGERRIRQGKDALDYL